MLLIILLGMHTMLITLLLNLYHLVSHTNKRKKFFFDLRHYFWDDPHLYKEGVYAIIRRCILSMNKNKSNGNVTPKPREDITREIELHTRYYNLIFIGLL